MTAVSAQGSAHRGGSEVSEAFISLYNKEFHTNRALPTLEVTSKDDLLRTEQPAMAVALLKEFLPTHEIKLADDEEEELIGDETDVLRFTQILDDGGNRLGLVYGYSFEIDEQQFEGKVELEVQLGLTAGKELVVKFERVEGDLIYYKRIVQDLRQKCFL